ncbi:type II toxin-antitoxin system HicA family toxin [Nostoc sp.]
MSISKVREVIKRLEADDWYLARTKGSHRQFKHPDKPSTDCNSVW